MAALLGGPTELIASWQNFVFDLGFGFSELGTPAQGVWGLVAGVRFGDVEGFRFRSVSPCTLTTPS